MKQRFAAFPFPFLDRRASGSVVLRCVLFARFSPWKSTDGLPGSLSVRLAVLGPEALYEALVAAEHHLAQEMGDEAAARLRFEPKGTLGLTDGVDYLAHSRRIYVVARNASSSAAC